jgi:hypothetical protein
MLREHLFIFEETLELLFRFSFLNVKLFTIFQTVLFMSLKLFGVEIMNYYYFTFIAVSYRSVISMDLVIARMHLII